MQTQCWVSPCPVLEFSNYLLPVDIFGIHLLINILERSQRPMEKTIFLRFMYAMTVLSSGLTVFEIMQLSTRRIKRQVAKYKLKKQLKKEEQQEDFR